jgi:hypothetical protein
MAWASVAVRAVRSRGVLGQASLPAITMQDSFARKSGLWAGAFYATGEHTSGVESRPARNGDSQVWSRLKVDNFVNHVNLTCKMANENEKPVSLIDVGQKLVGHSKSAEFTANRGLVVELFPFIFEASSRMSARSISRFLQEEQNIRLSAVTITKALNDPQKSWLSFFESIESSAIIIAKHAKTASFKYLYLSKADYENRTSLDKEGMITGMVARGVRALIRPEWVAADKVIREKWFSIGVATRLKAKPYLEEHLMSLEDKF